MKQMREIKIDIVQGKMPYYVYLLYKPDGTPFYVGKGKSNRLCAHEAETRSFIKGRTWKGINTFKLNTIKKIWENNQCVYYMIDSWHNSSELAGSREIELVDEIGRRILNNGPLVNIRDGGEVWSEETRRLFSEKMKEYWANPENHKLFSEKMKQYWADHPEICEQISASVKSYVDQHPEFIESLQIAKDDWIKNSPEEYQKTEEKRLSICQSDAHRANISEIMVEYFRSHPEELERIKIQGACFWENNDLAKEDARQRAIENESHKAIINWLETEPEKCREKWDKHSEYLKEWHQTEEGIRVTKQAAEKRNRKFRTEEHRQHMSKATAEYFKNNPEAVASRVAKVKETNAMKRTLKEECLNIIAKNLIKDGKVVLKGGRVTPKIFHNWKKKGLLPDDFPSGLDDLQVWQVYLNKISLK